MMKRQIAIFLLALCAAMPAAAQKAFTYDLWPDGLPNTNGVDLTEPYDNAKYNYKPQLLAYLPAADKASGRAVVCLPGGAYVGLALDHEGRNWAPFFNERGIALFVLTYRMPRGMTVVPESDAFEAIRALRRNAKEWNLDTHKIGIMGHSAGGHLCSTVATHSTGDARPDFQILLYPVITMDSNFTHKVTRECLIGKNPTPEMVRAYSNDLQVKPGQAPAIIFLAGNDDGVTPINSLAYYLALQKAGVEASLHIYPTGGHGYGMLTTFPWHDQMLEELDAWLKHLK